MEYVGCALIRDGTTLAVMQGGNWSLPTLPCRRGHNPGVASSAVKLYFPSATIDELVYVDKVTARGSGKSSTLYLYTGTTSDALGTPVLPGVSARWIQRPFTYNMSNLDKEAFQRLIVEGLISE